MENNFIQMVALAGQTVAYTIGPIFKHIIDCVQMYFTHGTNGTPHIIVQRYQVAASRWPNNISSAIFKNRTQNIECSFGCVGRSAILLKSNVAKFIQHGPIMIAIDCNGLSLFIFEEKWPNCASGPKSTPNSDSGVSAFQCMSAGFLYPKCYNFACLQQTRQ